MSDSLIPCDNPDCIPCRITTALVDAHSQDVDPGQIINHFFEVMSALYTEMSFHAVELPPDDEPTGTIH